MVPAPLDEPTIPVTPDQPPAGAQPSPPPSTGGPATPPPAPEEGSVWDSVEGVEWLPLYKKEAVETQVSTRTRQGLWGGGAVLAACIVVALLRQDVAVELLTLGVAAAVGLFLVMTGVGLVSGEVLYAAEKTRPVRPPDPVLGVMGGGLGATFSGLTDGLKGLTPGRALVFAGAALLIGLVVGGGLAAGEGEDGEESGTPSAPSSGEPSPAPSDD